MRLADVPNRREYVGPAVDAVMSWWLGAFTHEDAGDADVREGLLEWWTEDGADAALEVVHAILQALEESGFAIARRVDGEPQ